MGLQPQLEEGIQEVLTAAQASRSQVLGSINESTAGFREERHGHLGWSPDKESTAADAAPGECHSTECGQQARDGSKKCVWVWVHVGCLEKQKGTEGAGGGLPCLHHTSPPCREEKGKYNLPSSQLPSWRPLCAPSAHIHLHAAQCCLQQLGRQQRGQLLAPGSLPGRSFSWVH